jgi:ATP-dependent DNA helicase RecG
LDLQLLQQYKFNNQSQETDNWLFLKDNGLATKTNSNYYLTNAGALLFSKNPVIALKRKCGIKISHYHGTTPNFSGEPNFRTRPFTIEGPLLIQIQEAIKYYSQFVKQSAPKLVGATFQPTVMIPDWAFQEAVTNAVIHRDYSIQDDIHVRFFDDHIEIESPGTYPANITVKNIRSERFARNSIIQRTLSRFSYAPNLDIGEGVDRIFKVMLENNLYEPLYYPPTLRPHSVLLVLFNTVKVQYWDIVSSYLDEHITITNSEARKITGVNDTLKMSRYLNEWLEKGLLLKGGSTRTAFYTKVGVDLNPFLFSTTPDKSNY